MTIIQSVAISLGVGSSTLAIINFFVAIKDGTISPEERNMMGVVYVVLRVSMVLILLTTLVLGLIHAFGSSFEDYFTAYKAAQWTLIAVLYTNAVLMTKHLMSSHFGPSVQASAWYTLGIIAALLPLNLHNFTYWQFIMGYAVVLTFAVILVNSFIMYLSPRKEE